MASDQSALHTTLKRAASALKKARVPFALGGGFACYARGGPSSDHDIDFMVPEEYVERALQVLADAGMTPVRPPEDWLLKAYDDDVLVDLIHKPANRPVTLEMLERADVIEVDSVRMPVLDITEVLITKVLALSEQHCNLRGVVQVARSLREQVDWARLRRETSESPFAAALFTLLERLRVVDPPATLQVARSEAATGS